MTVWAHSMIKNESRWLWYSVVSVVEHVDKVLLWDTGSSDESLKIQKDLQKIYPNKIILNRVDVKSKEDFAVVRQKMLDATKSDWFMVLDGDEIWYEAGIKKAIGNLDNCEAIVVPTINLLGDIYHYQDKSSGNYQFGNLKGHYNLRFIKRNIEGLHSQGVHGVWGWADKNNKMIQERNTYKFINTPYIHATNIERSTDDMSVIKRKNKLKFEFGTSVPLDFYYPEAFFKDRPNYIQSPWKTVSGKYKFRAFFETPLRKIKRHVFKGKVGY